MFCIADWQENQYDIITADYPGIWTNLWEHRNQSVLTQLCVPDSQEQGLVHLEQGNTPWVFISSCQQAQKTKEMVTEFYSVLPEQKPAFQAVWYNCCCCPFHAPFKHLDTLGQICASVLLCGGGPRASDEGRRSNSSGALVSACEPFCGGFMWKKGWGTCRMVIQGPASWFSAIHSHWVSRCCPRGTQGSCSECPCANPAAVSGLHRVRENWCVSWGPTICHCDCFSPVSDKKKKTRKRYIKDWPLNQGARDKSWFGGTWFHWYWILILPLWTT